VLVAYATTQAQAEGSQPLDAGEADALQAASLRDSNALYFAAGPADETQGLFGALRAVV
jgi:hypothetical protein